MIGFVWEVFKLTGNVNAYLLFKALEKGEIHNGRETLRDEAETYRGTIHTNFVSKPIYLIKGKFVTANGNYKRKNKRQM